MLNFKRYFYYSQIDPDKEPIDRIIATDYDAALEYFAERKQMNHKIFLEIYEIESE
jgi:hypothetical protein